MELLVLAILLTITGAQGSQLEGPENTVGVVGSKITLKCPSPSRNCSAIFWAKYKPGNTMFHASGDIMGTIDAKGVFSCSLVIKSVDMTHAGRYSCIYYVSEREFAKDAYLIILQAQPKCMTTACQGSTEEGDPVRLTCEVTYDGNHTASVLWKDVRDATPFVENGNTISQSYSVVASAPEIPSFTCTCSFQVVVDVIEHGDLATNIPTATCKTSAVKVLSKRSSSSAPEVGIGIDIGHLVAILFSSIAFAILRLRF